MIDPLLQNVRPSTMGALTADAYSSRPMLDRVADAATMGLGSAVVSGLTSIANTFLPTDSEFSTERILSDMGATDTAAYYAENKEAIDTAGTMLASIPGYGLGVKALQLARSGRVFGTVGRALNFLPSQNRTMIAQAVESLAAPGGTMATQIGDTVWKRLATAVGDNVLTAAAGETGVLLLTHDSPTMKDYSFSDWATNAVGFGTFFGGLEFLRGANIIRKAALLVDSQARAADAVSSKTIYGLKTQNDISQMVDSMLQLDSSMRGAEIKYTYGGETQHFSLLTGARNEQAKQDAMKFGLNKIRLMFNDLAGGNVNIGQAVAEHIEAKLQNIPATELGRSSLRDEIVNILAPMRKLQSNNALGEITPNEKALFVRLAGKEGKTGIFDNLYEPGTHHKTPVQLADGVTAEDIKFAGYEKGKVTRASDAFAQGNDIYFARNGVPSINPNSSKLFKTRTELTSPQRVVDVETGAWGVDPVRTAADDIVNPGKDVRLTQRGVSIAGKEYPVPASSEELPTHLDPVNGSARWIWASQQTETTLLKYAKAGEGELNAMDLPALQRMEELIGHGEKRSSAFDDINIVDAEGGSTRVGDIEDLRSFVQDQKRAWLVAHHAEGAWADTRELGVMVNAGSKWVEDVIGNNFARRESQATGEFFTRQALRPRTVTVLLDDQEQLYMGKGGSKGKFQMTDSPLNLEGLAKSLGVKFTRTAEEAKGTVNEVGVAKGSAAFMQPGIGAGNKIAPLGVHVETPPPDYLKQLTGLNLEEITAHELGHALDFYVATTHNELFARHVSVDRRTPAFMRNADLTAELRRTSRSWKPTHWKTQPNYVAQGDELFADNFAMWMANPQYRKNMPEFAKLFAKDLEPFEQFFRQRMFERINGPMLGSDASLAFERDLQLARDRARTAVTSILKEDSNLLPNPDNYSARMADSLGAGSSGMWAADANYGDKLRTLVNYLGRVTDRITSSKVTNSLTALAADAQRVADPAAAAELSMITTRLRKAGQGEEWYLHTSRNGEDTSHRIVNKQVYEALRDPENTLTIDQLVARAETGGGMAELRAQNPLVKNYLRTWTDLNYGARQEQQILLNAKGIMMDTHPDRLYVPPVDTARYPHVAFVRRREAVGAVSDIHMITAKDAQQLDKLAAEVPAEYEVLKKDDTEAWFKAKGQYDYQSTINETQANSMKMRSGVLSDFFPETRAENVLSDFANALERKVSGNVKHSIELYYGDLFSDLRALSEMNTASERSVAQGQLATKAKKILDPFGDYINTALNISKKDQFPVLSSLNEFVDRVGKKLGQAYMDVVQDAKDGLVSWEEANRTAARFGLPQPFNSMESYLAANERVPRNLLGEWLGKGNALLSTFTLGIDVMNGIVNALSTPIMAGMEVSAIKSMIGKDAELAGVFNELTTVLDPATKVRVPSFLKMLANSLGNYWKDDGALLNRYMHTAGLSDEFLNARRFVEDVAPRPFEDGGAMMNRMNSWMDQATTWSGTRKAEEFTRFVSADIMRQMAEPLVNAGKMSIQEADTMIATFVNRVQGNYLASQRPGVFQGTAGRTISLFQTYMFNVVQQLTRHIATGNNRALLTFAGLQTSMYGLNGLPYFDAVNSHLASMSSNPQHKDAYTALAGGLGDYGKWLLYGTPSAFPLFDGKGPAVYSRGDISPRTLIGLPTSPVDIPVVQAASKLVSSVGGFFSQIGQGSSLSDAMLHALEHQGISRPLAGFAQVLQGRATTKDGSLISAAPDLYELSTLGWAQSRLVSFGGVERLLGAKPLDDSIIMDNYYKNKKLQLQDKERLDAMGVVVKQKLARNQAPSEDEVHSLMENYVQRGGHIENFSSAVQRWSRDANTSVANQMADRMGTPYAQRLQVMMGGQRQMDYTSQLSDQE